MVAFSWKNWVQVFGRVSVSTKGRRPRRVRLPQIEGLENRTLLTANLPVAVNDVYDMNANSALNGQSVLINDFDADGDNIDQAFVNSPPAHGSFSMALDGTFVYVPTNGFVGTDSFTYTARDGEHGENSSNVGIVTIHVGTQNNAPVAQDASFTTPLNTVLEGTVTGTDDNNDPLTFVGGSIQSAHGFVVLQRNGSFTYTPDNGYSGPDSFTFVANDGAQDSAEATVSITVGSSSGSTPTANSATFNIAVDTPLTATLTGSDPEGDALIFHTVVSTDNGILSLNSTSGEFTFTPNAGFVGTDSFTFTVSDGTTESAPATVTINVGDGGGENNAPVANARNLTTPLNTTLNDTLTASDADGDALSYVLGATQPQHGTVNVNANGTFSYTPESGYSGTDQFTFKVNDGTTDSAEAVVTITVGGTGSNNAPVATSANASTSTNATLQGVLQATDADNDQLTFSVGSTVPAHGALTINPNGTYTYLPQTGYTGTDSFSFRANDGTTNSNEATVTITIGSIGNSAPVANSVTFSTAADNTLTGTLTGSDADGDGLAFIGGTPPSHGTVVLNPSGAFTYTPDSGFNGTDTFTFRVNDGTQNSAVATVTIHVGNGVNTPPVAQPLTFTTGVSAAYSGALIATDADSDNLAFTIGTTAPTHGSVTINSSGLFTYTPLAGYVGDDSFTYKVNDGTVDSAEATVTVHVGGSNSGPQATPLTVNTNINTTYNGSLSGTDPEGDPLTFLAGTVAPQHGSVTISSAGTFIYTPDSGYTGDDTFSFRVNDGTLTSSEALVTIHVGSTGNSAPVPNPQIINTNLDSTLNGSLTAVDAEGDPLTFSQGSVTASHGVLTINQNGSFTYIPNAGYTGDDLFSFKANDGTQDSSEAIVILHILPTSTTNHNPTVVAGDGSVAAGGVFNGSLSALGTDADGDQLSYTAVTQPLQGTLNLSPDGTFTYTPNSGFTGTDTFTFRANDSLADSNIATFTVNVGSTSDDFDVVLSSNPGTIATRKKSALPLDSSATLASVNPSASFANAAISAEIIAGKDSHDRIFVLDGGSVDVRGKKIRFNGTEVARISGGKRGSKLQVDFNGSATADAVGAVLRQIALRTTKHAGRNTRTIEIKVSADGSTSSGSIDANVA